MSSADRIDALEGKVLQDEGSPNLNSRLTPLASRSCEALNVSVRSDKGKLAASVEALLHASPYLALRTIKCEFDGESLFLRGRVPTFYTKQVAFMLVERVGASVEIIDQIEVVPPAPRRSKPR